MQHTWAVLMCPAGGIDGIPPLLWTDVVPQSFSAFSLSGTTEDRYARLLTLTLTPTPTPTLTLTLTLTLTQH